jgi:hypothetical protein
MAKKKQPDPEITPPLVFESSDPVIFHVPDSSARNDVPARDFNHADLEYLARVRALQASGGEPVTPATLDELEALADELVASGSFSRTPPPEPPADPAKEN